MIIFDLLEISENDYSVTEKQRKVLGVMVKNSKQFAKTAGWGFEGFGAGDPANRVVTENYEAACFACHTSEKASDYVFSKWRN